MRGRVVLTDDVVSSPSSLNSTGNHVGDGLTVEARDAIYGKACEENAMIGDRVEAAKVETATADVIVSEYPVDCFPDKWYNSCPSCLEETPLMLRWKEMRYRGYQLVENKYFETVIIVLILLSSMTLVGCSRQVHVQLLTSESLMPSGAGRRVSQGEEVAARCSRLRRQVFHCHLLV